MTALTFHSKQSLHLYNPVHIRICSNGVNIRVQNFLCKHLFGPLLGRHGWHTFEAPEQHCLLRQAMTGLSIGPLFRGASGGAFRLAKGAKAIGIGDVGVLMGVRGAQRSSF
jgi:hypothetical protein